VPACEECPCYVCFERDVVVIPVCVRLADDVPSVVVADEPRSVGDLIECFFCVHGVLEVRLDQVRELCGELCF